MTTVHHIARAVGTASTSDPQYQVQLRAGRHRMVADEPQGTGADAGPSPFGLLLSGLVACTLITLRMYAERKGWTFDDIEVDARFERPEDGDAFIDRTITLPADLSDEQRQRLAEIADRTPVTVAVRAGTPVATTIKVAGAVDR